MKSVRLLNDVAKFSLLLLSVVGLFLSIWIVIPAPTFFLLPLGVGAPEVSPWLLGFNALTAGFAALKYRDRWSRFALAISLGALVLSALPLLQLPATIRQANTAMQESLGADYLTQISPSQQRQMRRHPFVLADNLQETSADAVRYTPGIEVAAPDGEPLTMDVYRPAIAGKYPAVVVIYGGAWQRGEPSQDAEFNRYLAARGYSVLAIDYRHAPRYRFPAQIEDVQTAFRFIQQHADEYEVDLERVAILGRSAGAHLAMLAAYQPGILSIRAVVNYYGPVDLTAGYYDLPFPDPIHTRSVLEAFLGGTPQELPALYQKASPYTYVTQAKPPTLLIYGKHDHIVQAKFGQALRDRLHSVNSTAVYIEIPWAEHAFDAVFSGLSNQLAVYYTERFLAWALH